MTSHHPHPRLLLVLSLHQAMAVSVPSSAELLDQIPNADPVLLHEVRMYVVRKLADRLRPELEKLIKENDDAPGER